MTAPEEYRPSGPCESSRVRKFADESLDYVRASPELTTDKAKFMIWMQSLTNDILDVHEVKRINATVEAPSSSSSSRGLQNKDTKYASSMPTPNAFVPSVISADMREVSDLSIIYCSIYLKEAVSLGGWKMLGH